MRQLDLVHFERFRWVGGLTCDFWAKYAKNKFKTLLDGQSDGGGLDDGASGRCDVDRVRAGGEAVGTESVGIDSSAAAAAEQTESSESKEQGKDTPAAGAARQEEEEQTSKGDTCSGREADAQRPVW
jgi:hypothetical protein